MVDSSEHTVVLHVLPGEEFDGRWRIEDRIGQGAMGSVFRGRDLESGRPVAVKILSPEHCRKPKVLARFEREAQLLTTLRHPNIVQFHGWGRRGALPYLVMQYLEGLTLSDVLAARGGTLPLMEVVGLVRQVALGLTFLHTHGLVHRDVKPQNIIVSAPAHVTILDLGVVRDQSKPGLTRPGAMVGTPYYMSPEQILGAEDVDQRTDVYALAAVTFELFTGRPPFLGDNNFEVLYSHKNTPPPDVSKLVRGVPPAVGEVLCRAMSKARGARPESANAFAQALERAAALKRIDLSRAFPFLQKVRPSGEKTHILERPVRPTRDSRDIPMAEQEDVVSVSSAVPADGPGSSGHSERTWVGSEPSLPQVRDLNESGPTRLFETPAFAGPATGTLRVMTMARGRAASAALLVDGVRFGKTPRSTELPAGRHVIRVELKGHRTIEREVEIQAGGSTTLRLELET